MEDGRREMIVYHLPSTFLPNPWLFFALKSILSKINIIATNPPYDYNRFLTG
ncbi:MAG: hypothetical protein AB1546_11585 [bacterium]